jgi:hypothetical protein
MGFKMPSPTQPASLGVDRSHRFGLGLSPMSFFANGNGKFVYNCISSKPGMKNLRRGREKKMSTVEFWVRKWASGIWFWQNLYSGTTSQQTFSRPSIAKVCSIIVSLTCCFFNRAGKDVTNTINSSLYIGFVYIFLNKKWFRLYIYLGAQRRVCSLRLIKCVVANQDIQDK